MARLGTSTAKAGQEMAGAQQKASGFAGSLKRVGETAAGFLLASAVQAGARRAIAMMQSTVRAASDLGESVNAVQKTFEGASGKIAEFGKTSAESVGLSTRAFNQMATPLGAILKNQGFQLDEVADHTINLTKRASDMASVFNTDVSDALMAIQAALRGETEPIRRYGVSISEVAIQQQALATTGKAAASELTAQEKAVARLDLVFEQTEQTAGDFVETSDGLANSQRISTAQIENAQAKIGTAFLPVMAKAAQFTGMLAEAFSALPGPAQLVVAVVAALGAAAAIAAPKILAARLALEQMSASGSRVQAGLARTAVAVGKVAAAMLGLQVAGALASSLFQRDLNPQVDAATKGLTEWNRQGELAGEAARLFGSDAEQLQRALAALAVNGFSQTSDKITDFIFGLAGASSPLDEAKERVTAFDQALARMVSDGHAAEAGAVVEEMARKAGISVEKARGVLPAYSAALEVGAGKTKDLGEAAHDTAGDIDTLHDAFSNILGETFDLEEAQDNAADAVARLKEQVNQQREENELGAGSLRGNSQAARDNRDAVRELVGMYADLAFKYEEAGVDSSGLRTELEKQLTKMGFTRAEVRKYVAQLDKIPRQKLTEIRVNNAAANNAISETARRLHTLPGTAPIYISPSWQYRASGGITGAASGGQRGGMVMVGEQGPELVHLPYGSRVHTAGASREMLRGGRGEDVREMRWTVMPGGSGDFEHFLTKLIKRYVRIEGGGSVQTAYGTFGR